MRDVIYSNNENINSMKENLVPCVELMVDILHEELAIGI